MPFSPASHQSTANILVLLTTQVFKTHSVRLCMSQEITIKPTEDCHNVQRTIPVWPRPIPVVLASCFVFPSALHRLPTWFPDVASGSENDQVEENEMHVQLKSAFLYIDRHRQINLPIHLGRQLKIDTDTPKMSESHM